MTDRSLLNQLCAACGIEVEYTDVWGKPHAVPDSSKRQLLAAMQVEMGGGSDSDLAHAIDELEARSWCRPLKPVQVVHETESAPHCVLTVRRTQAQAVYRWRLTLESGDVIDGQCTPAALALVGERSIAGDAYARHVLPLPPALATGYHRLEIVEPVEDAVAMALIVVPGVCYLPPSLQGDGKAWGPVVQLYALRSQRNWGMGDFSDLNSAIGFAAAAGADMVGTNPLHALFPNDPSRASPYSPSSRHFLNVLYLDLEAVADFSESEEARSMVQAAPFQAQLQALRDSELVSYREVGALKLSVLEILYRHFLQAHLDPASPRGLAFRQFEQQGGSPLRRHALFEAMQEHFSFSDAAIHGWLNWPAEYHDPDAVAVTAFAATHAERIAFFIYLQWLAELQLAAAAQRADEHGLAIGLYQDIAVGCAADGADAWIGQPWLAQGVHVGAPPDEFNPMGQDWGLPPWLPTALRDVAYAPFIAMLRQNMRHAGALRLDHVMGLMRLYWVPAGARPDAGAYVQYPFDDLIGIVALESRRNACMVVGEDLGTVPTQVRAMLARSAILSYRLFYFEKEADGTLTPPAAYPPRALVAVSTHDLPTLTGFWQGDDIDWYARLGLYPSEQVHASRVAQRAEDRRQCLRALQQAHLLPGPQTETAAVDPAAYPVMSTELAQAIHVYLARTPAKVFAVQMEDLFGQVQQVNLPGGGAQYPNWQRKLPVDLEAWQQHPRLRDVVQAVRRERGVGMANANDKDCPIPAAAATPLDDASPFAPSPSSIPRATYRVQLCSTFTFADAEQLIPYLAALGVSHCYASPYFKARPGSTHGYDIIDHNMLNPEIGSEADFERYLDALRQHGMSQILDIVPNHMAVMGSDNAWWLDVLENGQSARHAEFFDIDWQPQKEDLRDKVLVAVLSDQYGNVLEQGGLKLVFDKDAGEFSIWYAEHRFPIDPCCYPRIAGLRLPALVDRLGADHPQVAAFQSLITAFGYLPPHTETDPGKRAERERDKQIHKQNLAALCASTPEIAGFIQQNVDAFNGDPADQKSFDELHQLIKAQACRLGYWRVASDEINYRHFADVTSLAGLCTERDEVFDATHRMVTEQVVDAKVEGLRVDHTDGLYDPLQYFWRLRHLQRGADDHAATAAAPEPLYVVIEKILALHERLPDGWPIHGTTGYDFANLLNGIFVDAANESRMDRVYAAFIGEHMDFDEILSDCKKSIMQVTLASQLSVLVNQLSRIAQMDRHTCDFTSASLHDALVEITACFPVYRTYVTAAQVSPEDARTIEQAVAAAKRRSHVADISVFDFVRDALLTRLIDGKSDAYRDAVIRFAMKFQQFSSPVMAKGMEDTSFYIYHRLISLNEVGSDPRDFGISLAAFHAAGQERARQWPHTMLAGSTHDSKRSEDVRARINVLSEMPALWRLRLQHWRRLNRSRKVTLEGHPAPSRNDEYLLYQTLIGCWPLDPLTVESRHQFSERIERNMLKAVREAKQMTSWINPNPAYEDAVIQFVRALLAAPLEKNAFLQDFLPFQQQVSRLGMFNSLSQTLIRLTSPGMPDIYQGNELWNFSMVDPDNRRPIDYRHRRALLDALKGLFAEPSARTAADVRQLLAVLEDGRAKLYLSWKTLQLRKTCDGLFRHGDYLALHAHGTRAHHLCAYARRYQNKMAVVIAPRFFNALTTPEYRDPIDVEVWKDTSVDLPQALHGTSWLNVLTGESLTLESGNRRLPIARVLAHFPCALLVRQTRHA